MFPQILFQKFLYDNNRSAALCHFEALQVLSAYGADFAVTNSDKQTAMHLTLPSSNLACIRFLGQRGKNNIHNILGTI